MVSRHLPATHAPLPRALSRRLWDLDWGKHLPWHFDEITVEHADFDGAVPFMKAHYGTIFEAESKASRFLHDPMTDAKLRYCREMDVFLFRDAGATVGVVLSHPTDWSSYYVRSAAFLPAYRGRNLQSRWFEASYAPLRAVGVERIEAECAPSNAVTVCILNKLGFAVTATSNTERFGALVRFTKFLQEEAETTFLRQFCAVSMQRLKALPEERRTR
jgi:hypothetical protein